MRSDEKQKLIDQSLVNCHLNAEAPRDRGEVKLYELSKALEFETSLIEIRALAHTFKPVMHYFA